jgi:hypothetical protein
MDNTDLLVAAHVRDLAEKLRHRDSKSFYETLSEDISYAVRNNSQAAWLKENPLANFIPTAYRLLRDTHLQIKGLQ